MHNVQVFIDVQKGLIVWRGNGAANLNKQTVNILHQLLDCPWSRINLPAEQGWVRRILCEGTAHYKVSQTNKWSWDQAIDLPNYVVHVYQSIYEKI